MPGVETATGRARLVSAPEFPELMVIIGATSVFCVFAACNFEGPPLSETVIGSLFCWTGSGALSLSCALAAGFSTGFDSCTTAGLAMLTVLELVETGELLFAVDDGLTTPAVAGGCALATSCVGCD